MPTLRQVAPSPWSCRPKSSPQNPTKRAPAWTAPVWTGIRERLQVRAAAPWLPRPRRQVSDIRNEKGPAHGALFDLLEEMLQKHQPANTLAKPSICIGISPCDAQQVSSIALSARLHSSRSSDRARQPAPLNSRTSARADPNTSADRPDEDNHGERSRSGWPRPCSRSSRQRPAS